MSAMATSLRVARPLASLLHLGVRHAATATGATTARAGLVLGSATVPHPEKRDRGGEDAVLGSEALGLLGVADGVGGWSSQNIDSGIFSRSLLRGVLAAAAGGERDLATIAALATKHVADEKVDGGSTLLLARYDDERGVLDVMNLGDCGLMVLRPAARQFGSGKPVLWPRVVFRSQEQTHFFNCPYQLSLQSVQTHETRHENLALADHVTIQVQPHDIVLAATDGVFDNLFDMHIQGVVSRHLAKLVATPLETKAVQELAEAIAHDASHVGQHGLPQEVREDGRTTRRVTPFSLGAKMEGLDFGEGGKLDDVGVVCAVVVGQDGRASKEFQPVLKNFS